MCKPNKLNYTTVKFYRVRSLLNYLGKVYEKVAAETLAEWCEINKVLHEGQM